MDEPQQICGLRSTTSIPYHNSQFSYEQWSRMEIEKLKDAMKRLNVNYFNMADDRVLRAHAELEIENLSLISLESDHESVLIWPLHFSDLDEQFKTIMTEKGFEVRKELLDAFGGGDLTPVYPVPAYYSSDNLNNNHFEALYNLPVTVEVASEPYDEVYCYVAEANKQISFCI